MPIKTKKVAFSTEVELATDDDDDGKGGKREVKDIRFSHLSTKTKEVLVKTLFPPDFGQMIFGSMLSLSWM